MAFGGFLKGSARARLGFRTNEKFKVIRQWMHIDLWASEWIDYCNSACIEHGVSECVDHHVPRCIDRCVSTVNALTTAPLYNRSPHQWIHWPSQRRYSEWIDHHTVEWIDHRTSECIDRRYSECFDHRTVEWIDHCTSECIISALHFSVSLGKIEWYML